MSIAAVMIVAAACGTSASTSPVKLTPSMGDRAVFYSGTGHGNSSLVLTSVGVDPASSPTTTYDGKIAIVGSCVGKGTMWVTLKPGGLKAGIGCFANGGAVGSDTRQSGIYPYPQQAVVSAPNGSSWSLAIVDPSGSNGVSTNQHP